MIRLHSAPSSEASARLEDCKHQAREAETRGTNPSEAVKTCYRHPEVKASIVKETADKCAYCESKMLHVHWGDVEHIKPKKHFPECALDYDNLTLACAKCNNNKKDYWSEAAPILDPYIDDPTDHLIGLGTLVWHRDASETGQRSIDLLELNRDALRERRFERLQRLSPLVDRYRREPEGGVKDALAAQLRREISDESEFALVVRCFLLSVVGIPLQEL